MSYSEMAIELAVLALVVGAARVALAIVFRTILMVREWVLVPHIAAQAAKTQARQEAAVARVRSHTLSASYKGERTARREKALAAIRKGILRMLEWIGGTTLAGWRAVSRGIGAMRRYLRIWVRVLLLTRTEKAERRAEQRAWRRVEESTRWVKPTHQARALRELRKRGAVFVGRLTFRGEVPKYVTVYRIRDQGEWETATLVHEDGRQYWLPGDPKEDPQLEGFLVDRKAIQNLAAV